MKSNSTALILVALSVAVADAHTGVSGARIDHETVVRIDEGRLRISYSTQLNRPAAFLELLRMDTDGDGQLSRAEQSEYFARLQESLIAGLEVQINGVEVSLEPAGQVELSMPFRKTWRFLLAAPDDWPGGAVVELHNDNYLDYPGSITVTLDPGTAADVIYDSRWDGFEEEASVGDTAEDRDVVFQYCRGTGKIELGSDHRLAATERGPLDPSLQDTESTDPLLGGGSLNSNHHVAILLLLSSGALALVSLLAFRAGRRRLGGVLLTATCAAVFTGGHTLFLDPSADESAGRLPADVEAAQVFRQLHRQIYDSFAARSESELYDTLAAGLDGRLLDEVYNEVYRATLGRRDRSTRFRIRRVKPLETTVLSRAGAAFRVNYRWRVYGTVTHFGHTHARLHEYEAVYLVRHGTKGWRISQSEIRRNHRVEM